PSVAVLDPHSRSAFPLATASNRVSVVTGTHSTLSALSFSRLFIRSTTRLQRSTVKPVTCLSALTKENGAASVRWAILIVPVRAMSSSRSARDGLTVNNSASIDHARRIMIYILQKSRKPKEPGGAQRLQRRPQFEICYAERQVDSDLALDRHRLQRHG